MPLESPQLCFYSPPSLREVVKKWQIIPEQLAHLFLLLPLISMCVSVLWCTLNLLLVENEMLELAIGRAV